MPAYEVDYKYTVEEFGNTLVYAIDADEAEALALDYIDVTFPENVTKEIEMVKEIKKNGV